MAVHSTTKLANGHTLTISDDSAGLGNRCKVEERDQSGGFVRFRYSGTLADCRTYVKEARGQSTKRQQAFQGHPSSMQRRAGALAAAKAADRTRRARLSKARQVSGSSTSYRMPDNTLLTVRRDGERWLVIESPQGGLAGGSQVFSTRRKADDYVTKRRRVIAKQRGRR